MRKQLAYFLARSQVPLEWVHSNGDAGSETIAEEGAEASTPPPVQPDDIVAALGNQSLSKHFRNFGKAVGVEEPKSVGDIYKLHLEAGRAPATAPALSSYRENVATTYVNAFVNAGFGNDKLLVDAPEGESWIYKNKDTGFQAAAASVGMSLLWDGEGGIDHIDKYSYSSEEQIKAGAFFATGILHAGIRGEPDLAWALLEDHISSQSKPLKIAAMMGTAVSHANWRRGDIATVMLAQVEETSIDVSTMAALTCGFTFVGSADGEIATAILQAMMELEDKALDSEWAIFYGVALALIFMGESSELSQGRRASISSPRERHESC
jgi:26S proteasome regulatory subunit N1